MPKPGAEQQLRDAIRARGLRVTQPRLAVLALLRAESIPLSHADVGDRLAIWRFEAVTGHEDHSHPHFVCTECGAVECMPDAELSLPRGRRAPRAVRARKVEVSVRGVCDDCA